MGKIVAVDLRMIFDENEQEFVVGCHKCEKSKGMSVKDIPGIAQMIPEFAMEHIKKCGSIVNV